MNNISVQLHGVLMVVFDLGIFITGRSGIGKSELALTLIDRGHQLVADDAPVFYRVNNTISGQCPADFSGLLEVRDLGIIDIKQQFGQHAFCQQHSVSFKMQLVDNAVNETNRLQPHWQPYELLGINLPELTIHAATTKYLPLLIETAAHQFKMNNSTVAASFRINYPHRVAS